ncbi:MAG: PDZ domain-containing protein [Anaerolineae bacterium]|nr:PDZ domain-containing protein [Anaerolineae bacterium]
MVRSSRPIIMLLLFLTPTLAAAQTPQPTKTTQTVRACDYIPGVSVPAVMPKDLANPPTVTPVPTAIPFTPTKVDAKTAALHLQVYNKLWNAVNDHYVYTNFNGHDWKAIGAKYEALVKKGLSQTDFDLAMERMIAELGDNHSYFATPAEIQKETTLIASQYNYVGIGALVLPIIGTQHGAIMTVFPKSPASDAGLKPHDSLLEVDGGPMQDANGKGRTLGLEGTKVTIKVQRPGEQARDLTLTRQRVSSSLPIDYCIVPTTRIGYIFLPTFLDDTIDSQVEDALRKMTSTKPLQGLILDNRMNTGGTATTANGVMDLFASGDQGEFISRDNKEPLKLVAHDVGGSQTVPLVVLVDVNTVSYGEIVSGVLRLAGRATIIGGTTLGNVERLFAYDMPDGSRLWLASETFQPRGEANGIWEETGIIPDISVPTRWDLFTEANDPALARAVDFLTHHK